MIESRPLAFFDTLFRVENQALLSAYDAAWPLVPAHYPPGWAYAFFEPNRFLSRALYHHLTSTGERCSVLDFGCYDGLLVAALVDAGLDAYGYESLPCEAMFKALGIAERVNQRKHCEAVVALGVAQEYAFADLLNRIQEENAGLPDVLFFDREPTRDTKHNKTYFDPLFLVQEGISVVQFPNCVSDRSRAQLLIWRRDADSKN